jgi:hypothetical protein
MKKTPFLIVLLTLLFSTTGLSQQTTGNLEGIVLDEAGEPLPHALVTVTGPSLQGKRGTDTSSDGFFRLIGLPVGHYTVEISLIGYRGVILEDVPIRLSQTTSIGEIELAIQAIKMPAMVITAERPLIDPSSAALGLNFDSEDYNSLPIDRDYLHVASLTPEANDSYLGDEVNFSGSTGMEIKYFIDGVDVTEPYRGQTGMRLPYNFVKETQVRAGAYEAEYRSSLGGITNVITQSGGNEFHGQIFGFMVTDQFAGEAMRAAWQPSKGDYTNYDLGIGLGGPIFRDKLWFYGSYGPSIVREDVEVPGHGFFEDKQTAHQFAGKLTWRPSDRNNLVFTVLGAPLDRQAVGAFADTPLFPPSSLENPDPYLNDIESSQYCLSIEGKHFVSEAFFIDGMVSRLTSRYREQPGTERGENEVRFIDWPTNSWSGGAGVLFDDLNVVTTVRGSGTLLLGDHNIKAGFEYKENKLEFDETWQFLYRMDDDWFITDTWVYADVVSNRLPSAYVQDSWRLGKRVRINAGLRWDGQYFIGTNGQVAQRILDQWQPRFGIVFQPGEIGRNKLSYSYGRFYQEVTPHIFLNFYVDGDTGYMVFFDHDPRDDPSGADTVFSYTYLQPEIDMKGQYYDEFSVGFEREIVSNSKAGVRGIIRVLGRAIDDGGDVDTGEYWLANPGSGPLDFLPKATRDHTSLEFYYQKTGGGRFNFLASYVLSRTYGNYFGLFNSDFLRPWPYFSSAFDDPETMVNTTGPLPNDRRHAFKFSGSYFVGHGLTAGASLSWMSGTPKTEWGGSRFGVPWYRVIGRRGSAGRMPSLWDLNLRFSYDMSNIGYGRLQPRFIMDLYHVGNPRTAVKTVETHYYALDDDGNQAYQEPNYDRPFLFQPPMAMRLGMELNF